MYEYRKMSSEEREEVLRLRKLQGYPLHSPPHGCQSEGHFLITAATFEHASFLSDALRRTNFEISMINLFTSSSAELSAWAVMPNHYHILLKPRKFEDIAAVIKLLHGRSSRAWNIEDGTVGRKVWFRYSDRRIRTEEHFYAAINYVHYNPVKHGYVAQTEDWMWSSFDLYRKDCGKNWLDRQWDLYPILDFGKGWDDY